MPVPATQPWTRSTALHRSTMRPTAVSASSMSMTGEADHPQRACPQRVSHEELVKRLARMGVRENVPDLRNKLTRGRFSAPFLLQVMAALGASSIDLEEALTDLATTN